MAMYHCSVKTIGRSGGSNVVNSAAYRSGEKLHEYQLDKTFYYSGKAMDVMHKEIMAPEKVPEWVKDREKLWNAVEAGEKRKDARLAREIEISLPREFSVDQNISLVKEYVQKEFVDRGMVADVCMHYGMKGDSYNPHAHVLLTTRDIDEQGFGKKNVEWNSKELLKEWRESWAELSNKHLSLNGIDQQIDHRSLKEQGIELVPQNVELPSDAKERLTEQRERQLEIMRENGERLKEKPEIALHAITNRQSTFTERDIARYVNSRTVDKEQYDVVMEKIKGHDNLVKLVAEEGKEKYTTKEMLDTERKMFKQASELVDNKGFEVNKELVYEMSLKSSLSKEQSAAVEYIMQNKGIANIVGYAGTGKTHMLDTAREVWEESGYRVKGAALSGIAAQGLERGAGIESRTVARRLIDWENGRDILGKKDILVVDEAGMLGTKDVARIVGEVKESGAKLVLIGDPQQLQAIEAGAAFRGIAEREGYLEMNNIKRQDIEWQKDATKMLAMGEVDKALSEYNREGKIHYHENKKEAMQSMVGKWMSDRKEIEGESQIMLAYKREDVRRLNEEARKELKGNNVLGEGREYELSNGKREMSIGDQVYFLRNDNGLEVKNGTLGEVVSVDKEGNISINVKDREKEREVSFNIDKYNYIDHGYAATVHKAQGVTVDRAYVMATKGYNQHIAYVAMSRHIKDVNLYWSRDEFSSFSDMKNQMSREARKENAIDYVDSAKEYAKERGIENEYKDIDVKNNELYGEKFKEFKESMGERLSRNTDSILERIEDRMMYKKDLAEVERFYGEKIGKEFKTGEYAWFVKEEKIGKDNYAIFKAKGEYKMMNIDRCFDMRKDEQAMVSMAKDGMQIATPSEDALWDRKAKDLSKEFGKEVFFGAEIGDRGKCGGEMEFEGNRYVVMHKYDEVQLIDKRNLAKDCELKDGDYMKINQHDIENRNSIVAEKDTEKYQKIEMEKQREMEIKMERSKGIELEMEM